MKTAAIWGGFGRPACVCCGCKFERYHDLMFFSGGVLFMSFDFLAATLFVFVFAQNGMSEGAFIWGNRKITRMKSF